MRSSENRSRPRAEDRPGRTIATARSGLGFADVATSGLPASGCSAWMRENNLGSHTKPLVIARPLPKAANPHDGEIITHAPNLQAYRWRSFTVDDGWGWIFTGQRRALARVCRLGMSARRPLLPTTLRSPWGCRAVWLDRGRRGSGGPSDGTCSQYLRELHQPAQVLAAKSSRPFVGEPQTNGVAERFNRTPAFRMIHASTATSRHGRRPRMANLTMRQSDVETRTAT